MRGRYRGCLGVWLGGIWPRRGENTGDMKSSGDECGDYNDDVYLN